MTTTLPSLASADWLKSEPTQRVLAMLNSRGFTARVVGGAVRNALLGLAVVDIDIATVAAPEQVISAAAAAGMKTVATGLQHGTVTVITGGHSFEVTTLRHDVETDGRHATVAFTDDWTADAARRDLTLNALYCDADGTIFDPLGGLDDVRARRVRFIGDAHQRIREDYLRILRFFRFTAQYAGGTLDAEGLKAAIEEREGLKRLSAERVRAELMRLLVAPDASAVIAAMAGHGMLTAILPVAPRIGVFRRLIEIEAAIGGTPDAALRLAALTVAVDEDAHRLGRDLRLSGEEREILLHAAGGPHTTPLADERRQRADLYHAGAGRFRRAVLLGWAGGGASSHDTGWRTLFELPNRWTPPRSPFAGRDLLARGIEPGPHVGAILASFEQWWVASDFPTDPVVLDAALARILAG